MIRFARVPLAQYWDEVTSLGRHHWHETEAYRAGQGYAPDKDRYLHYDDIGYYRQYVALDDERPATGRVVGYAGMYVMTSMHTGRKVAHEDAWFLRPDYRKGRTAIRLYRYVEADLIREGVEEITMTAKLANKTNRILEYLGYEHVANEYAKQIEGPP